MEDAELHRLGIVAVHPAYLRGQGQSWRRSKGMLGRISGCHFLRESFSTMKSPAQRAMRGDQMTGGGARFQPAERRMAKALWRRVRVILMILGSFWPGWVKAPGANEGRGGSTPDSSRLAPDPLPARNPVPIMEPILVRFIAFRRGG